MIPRRHYMDMPRMPRAVLSGVAHHLTQRGVDRQPVFYSDAQRQAYLGLVAHAAQQFGVQVLAYRLMEKGGRPKRQACEEQASLFAGGRG